MSTSVLLRTARSMAVLLSVVPVAIATAASAEQTINQSIDIQNKSDKASAGTQTRIAQLADDFDFDGILQLTDKLGNPADVKDS